MNAIEIKSQADCDYKDKLVAEGKEEWSDAELKECNTMCPGGAKETFTKFGVSITWCVDVPAHQERKAKFLRGELDEDFFGDAETIFTHHR